MAKLQSMTDQEALCFVSTDAEFSISDCLLRVK